MQWGSYGSGDGQFGNDGFGIAVDPSGFVYVLDRGQKRVEKFTTFRGALDLFCAERIWSLRHVRLTIKQS